MTVALDAQPSTLDIRVYAGDTFTARFTFVDQATGDPYPLTGAWAAQIRTAGDEVAADFYVDDTDADTGILVLSLSAAVTAGLVGSRRLVWDLEQATLGGVRTWHRGNVYVAADVTR